MTYLGLSRLVMLVTYETDDPFVMDILNEITRTRLYPLSRRFCNQFRSRWDAEDRSLLRLCFKESPLPMVNYLVWCARVLEIGALYAFLTEDSQERQEAISILSDFARNEEGCGHIPGDRHAVSIVWATLALIGEGKNDIAIALIKRAAVWLCDRVEKGFGIGRYESDAYEETAVLLGYPFDAVKVERNRCSFLATMLVDLAAFIEEKGLYADLVNDFEACDIVYNYWQFPNTASIFTIDNRECVNYPNIPHQPSLEEVGKFDYAEHIKHEPDSFAICSWAGARSVVLISALLKDRYFPKMWSSVIGKPVKEAPAAARVFG